MQRPAILLSLTAALMACQSTLPPKESASLRAELVAKTGPKPPKETAGICWADDTIPAIIETVTEQVLVRPEERGPDGTVTQAAAFRTETSQRIVEDRREVWFRSPCPEDVTLDFVATLQRALKARGYYTGALTGQLDAATRHAIRLYQEPLGLASDRLSLAAARRLGVAPGEFRF
ncbi:peptidoglycan-binding domain-containing protein [Pseudorhodobacter sp.]|uniref:peptidoglycan-binding domain-containing protein n=1 Tax=Pseudorhodobacter sp. TaxID=1934400 RepID=UPI0026476547|nr:peptidoglycan-binding domain-containing protein [Pseudorhodobacter sp.]MDN5786281.1 peptidoglycan-binding protein [Pseudorhodobacter sp.]